MPRTQVFCVITFFKKEETLITSVYHYKIYMPSL